MRPLPAALALAVLSVPGGNTAIAQDKEIVRSERETTDATRPSGTGLSLFVGVDPGLALSYPSDLTSKTESRAQGYVVRVKGFGTLVTEKVLVDLGGGWLQNKFYGRSVVYDPARNTSTTTNESLTIRTRAGFAEFAASYRFTPVWSAGLVGNASFGDDTSYGPVARDDEGQSVAAGVKVTWQRPFADAPFTGRLGATVLTDVSVRERALFWLMLNAEIGFDVIRPATLVRERDILAVREKVRTVTVEKSVEKTLTRDKVKFLFDAQVVNFETGSNKLTKRSETFLRGLAEVLMQQPNNWEKLEVEGHTDSRGGLDYNMKLSERRAATVRTFMESAGVPAERLTSAGYGPTRPLVPENSEVDLARNRRVEMNFEGVVDPKALREGIAELKDRLGGTP